MATKKTTMYWLAAMGVAALSYFLFAVTSSIYAYADNYTVAVVVNGLYGSNNYCQYLHPLFCAIAKILISVLPTADVFTTLVYMAMFVDITALSYLAISNVGRKRTGKWEISEILSLICPILGIFFYAAGINIWGNNYTVQTSFFTFSGLLILFYAMRHKLGRGWVIAGTVFLAFSFLMRAEGALLFIPFFLLDLAAGFMASDDKKEMFKKALRYLLPGIITVALLLISHTLYDMQEPYATNNRYTKYRTAVEDFPMENFSVAIRMGLTAEEKEEAGELGIDPTEYKAATGWMLADTDVINADLLEKTARAGSKYAYPLNAAGLKKTMRVLTWNIFHQDIHLSAMVVMTLLLLVWILFKRNPWWSKLASILAVLGGFLILFYFTMRGRALPRVWLSTFLAVDYLLVSQALDLTREGSSDLTGQPVRTNNTADGIFLLLLCICFYFSIGQVFANSTFHAPVTPLTAKVGVDESFCEETKHGDALYIWPSWYTYFVKNYRPQNKLTTRETLEHNISMGDWVYGQEYFNQLLRSIGAENPARALLDRPDTYLMDGVNDPFLSFMRVHYGDDIVFTEAGEVMGVKAYKVERAAGSGD